MGGCCSKCGGYLLGPPAKDGDGATPQLTSRFVFNYLMIEDDEILVCLLYCIALIDSLLTHYKQNPPDQVAI